MMKQIPLSQNKLALVDDKDFELVSQFKWSLWSKEDRSDYAIRKTKGSDRKTIQLHRFILGVTDPKIQVDHINGNGLDNRRCNLRPCTQSQNQKNVNTRKDNTSGYKGVIYNKGSDNWRAVMMIDKKRLHLGYFATAIEAAKAYNEAALKHHGEFAKLNKIDTCVGCRGGCPQCNPQGVN